VIEALVGSCPEEYGLPPDFWVARVKFLTLTYDILYLASKRKRLSDEQCNDVRLLSLRWGRAFRLCGFADAKWTSKFHEFHEHLYWDLLCYALYQRSSMVVESSICVAKGVSRRCKVFKRPRIGETRFLGAMRKLLAESWLRGEIDSEVSEKEFPTLLKAHASENPTKFIQGRTISFGAEKFELGSAVSQKAQNRILQICKEDTPPKKKDIFSAVMSPPVSTSSFQMVKQIAEREKRYRQFSLHQLRALMASLHMPNLRGSKDDLIFCLLEKDFPEIKQMIAGGQLFGGQSIDGGQLIDFERGSEKFDNHWSAQYFLKESEWLGEMMQQRKREGAGEEED
jgi:hypothetical protein